MISTRNQQIVFLEISVHLTGFSDMELLGTGMLESYFNVVMNKNSVSVVEAFLAASEEILTKNKGNADKIRQDILDKLMPDPSYDGLAKNIITMWYMGNWMNEMVSPTAYTQGLIWGVAGAHPPGAKQPGYDSWHRPPLGTIG
jgi:hypothetical protein